MKKYIYIFTLCIFFHSAFVAAQPGSLDSTFSLDGKLRKNGYYSGKSVAIQSDGKIVVVAQSTNPEGGFGLIRYNKTGNLDKTFGKNGEVLTSFYPIIAKPSCVVIQPDERIVVAGYSTQNILLARYKKTGALDQTFGVSGKIVSNINGGAYAIALQADGKIIAAGNVNDSFAVVRYQQDGTLDSSFGTNGLVETDIVHKASDVAFAIAIQHDGKIVVSGGSYGEFLNFDAILVRYTEDGQIDDKFGLHGKITVDVNNSHDSFNGVAIQPDGRIVVAGTSAPGNGTPSSVIIARYNKKGTIDSTFGASGYVFVNFQFYSTALGLVLQTDGKIITAGRGTGTDFSKRNDLDFALVRCKPNGVIDSSFGQNGKVLTDFGAMDYANAIALQKDEK